MKNIFNIDVGYKIPEGTQHTDSVITVADASTSVIIRYLLLGIVIAGILVIVYYFLLERKKKRELRLSEEKFWKNMK